MQSQSQSQSLQPRPRSLIPVPSRTATTNRRSSSSSAAGLEPVSSIIHQVATDIHQSGFGVRKLANGRLRVSSTNTATAKEKYDTRSVKAVDSFENIGPHTLPISFGSTLIKASPCVAAASGMDMTINWESTTSISKPRENNYSFVPPAAAKYFLWY